MTWPWKRKRAAQPPAPPQKAPLDQLPPPKKEFLSSVGDRLYALDLTSEDIDKLKKYVATGELEGGSDTARRYVQRREERGELDQIRKELAALTDMRQLKGYFFKQLGRLDLKELQGRGLLDEFEMGLLIAARASYLTFEQDARVVRALIKTERQGPEGLTLSKFRGAFHALRLCLPHLASAYATTVAELGYPAEPPSVADRGL